MATKKTLRTKDAAPLLETLKDRFHQNADRHRGLAFEEVLERLQAQPSKLWSLAEMERTGGEPDVVTFEGKAGPLLFVDCSTESPKGRRSLCYDQDALRARKENPPAGSALEWARTMGVTILDEAQYRALQAVSPVDLKTSSWIHTPESVRELGGALFCDRRFDRVFTYANGAQSYYAARGFRACLEI